MSAHTIISAEDECPCDSMKPVGGSARLVSKTGLGTAASADLLLGILGVIVLTAILGLSVYFVVKYLLSPF